MEKIFGIEDGRYRANNPRDKFFILCIHGEKKKVSSHHHEIFSFGERSAFFRTFVRADTWNDDFPPILIPDQRIQRRLKNKGERERERVGATAVQFVAPTITNDRSYCALSTRFRLSFHRFSLVRLDRYRPVSPFFSEAVIQFCIPASR